MDFFFSFRTHEPEIKINYHSQFLQPSLSIKMCEPKSRHTDNNDILKSVNQIFWKKKRKEEKKKGVWTKLFCFVCFLWNSVGTKCMYGYKCIQIIIRISTNKGNIVYNCYTCMLKKYTI